MPIGTGASASALCRYPQYTTIRGCTAWDNWGEGISTLRELLLHDRRLRLVQQLQQNIYISGASKYGLFQRNLCYCTTGNPIQGYVTQNCILLGDEKRNPPDRPDNMIVNNLALGGERNFAVTGDQMVRTLLVANNTFVNAFDRPGVRVGLRLFLCRIVDRRPFRQQHRPPGRRSRPSATWKRRACRSRRTTGRGSRCPGAGERET